MSNEILCNKKLKISKEINAENQIEVKCDLYEGHEGEHSKMFYHSKKIGEIIDNYRLGRITWKDEL